MKQVWFVDSEGQLSGGAAAINDVLRLLWWARPFVYLYKFAIVRRIEEQAYRWVAKNRHRMPGASAACEMKQPFE